jgi:hypothetical protein
VETWTTTEAAAHCNNVTAARLRSLAAAAGIAPVARQPGRKGENLWDAEAVREMQRERAGQGARTDLRRADPALLDKPVSSPEH